MNSGNAPTMKDVAREAGVALGTVSKVINGKPVGEAYRKKVEAAAKKLGYQVNSYARGLKTNKTYCVALVMPSLKNPFFAELTNALSRSLAAHGYRSVLMITNFDSDIEKKCFSLAAQHKIDGIIALTYCPDPGMVESVPVVTIDRHFSSETPCISSDNYEGGKMAASKLISLGCKNLLFFSTKTEVYSEVEKRGLGFQEVCRTEGVAFQTLDLKSGDSEVPFYRFLEQHIRDGVLEFDGIFCNSDRIAVRVQKFLESKGIRIPEDVQMIGYDGIVDFYTCQPVCSTIVQPIARMAETAVQVLLNQTESPSNITLPVYYLPGGTTRD
ncbi:MAG: LacI family DNA-binding transcriptional regulator [Lachnospiraceae bacterium]|nr:LacI family DNA-binding transcriptional regulator [Lachnospiraceae bacterium]